MQLLETIGIRRGTIPNARRTIPYVVSIDLTAARLKTFLNFYSDMAWYGVHVEGRYCGIADTIYGRTTRLANSGNWTHFRNADDWVPHLEEPLAHKKGKA